jgi:hypothetical protein
VSTTVIVLIVVIVVLALAVGGYFLARQRRSQRLQEHFGDEYERSVEHSGGDRKAAESELSERESRVRDLDIRELRPEERDGFTDRWAGIQRGFVDDPGRSLNDADVLVVEIMKLRGYPVEGDFDRRAEDLSVEHPKVVRHYREARAVHDAQGNVDTEKQRTAVTSYRSLVDALLGKGHDHDDADHDHDHADHDHADHRVDDTTDRPAGADRTDPADHLDHGSRNGTHRADVTTTTEEQTR